MKARHIAVFVGAAAAVSWTPLGAPAPSASARPCPDVEVVFARGTTEEGLGPTGEAFVDSLRARVGAKSVAVYPVNYPATTDFPTALDGVRDASGHVEATVAACPDTQLVLGGFSQGAAVMGFVTANAIPDGVPDGVPDPMPLDVANHVAAVALFGKPNARFMRAIRQPEVNIGPAYSAKTIDLCVPDDLICSSGTDFNAHMQYMDTGLVDQAATFAAGRVLANSRPATPPQRPAPAVAAPQAPAPAVPAPQAPASAAPPLAPAPVAPPQAPAPAPPPQVPPADVPPAPAPPAFNPLRPLPPGTIMRCDTVCHIIGPA